MGPTRKFVAISLSDQANDEGLCWPSVGSLMRRTGLSDRAIQQAIQFLEASGFMHLERREGRSTKFYLTPEAYSPPNEVHPEAGSPTPEASSETPERPSPTPEPRSPIIIKNRQRTSKEPTLAFERFWDVYPRSVGRSAAIKAWNKSGLDSLADRLIQDVTYRVLNDAAWQKKEFIPHASTYLNQERWTDEVQKYEAPRRNLSAVERVSQATRTREAERTADKRTLETDGGDLRPQVGQLIRGNGHG